MKDILVRNGHLNSLESQVIDDLCSDPTLEWLNPKRIIYLNASPDTCMDRINRRTERAGITSHNNDIEAYRHINLTELAQYKEALKNIPNLATTMEINANYSDRETKSSWVTNIIQQLPQL